MSGTRVTVGLLGAALFVVTSCQTPDTTIKPPLREEYILPPADDARFSSPPSFPKETLDSSMFKKGPKKPSDDLQGSGPAHLGTGRPGVTGY